MPPYQRLTRKGHAAGSSSTRWPPSPTPPPSPGTVGCPPDPDSLGATSRYRLWPCWLAWVAALARAQEANVATFVIVGAGLAGAKAAETLRGEGFDGDIVLLGTEPERPYERPPLSKGVLLGKAGRESAFVHPAGWYAENRVDFRPGVTVTAIDPAAHTVTADGGALGYDKLLLAT